MITKAGEGTYTVDITYNDLCVETRTYTVTADCCEELCHLQQPTGLRCTSIKNQTQLLWDPVPDAIGYEVSITLNDPACCGGTSGISIAPVPVQGTSYQIPSSVSGCFAVRVSAVCPDGNSLPSEPFCFNSQTACLSFGFERSALPGDPEAVDMNLFPNPADHSISIDLNLSEASALTLDMYDMQGKRVRQIDLPAFGAGQHTFKLGELGSLPEGMYIIKVHGYGSSIQKKLMLRHR
ncbi:MAG: T9SS type A sorting domain-containing protein [Bacteroidota bacterium]